MSKKRIIIAMVILIIILAIVGSIYWVKLNKEQENNEPTKENTKVGSHMDVVLSLEDKITENRVLGVVLLT